jgi:lysophospholipase L1-like esterase
VKRLGVALAAALAVLLLAEVALRVRARAQGFAFEEVWRRYTGRGVTDPVYVAHPYLGRAHRPGFVFRYRSDVLGREVNWRFNSFGYRGPEIEIPKPPGRTRVLCLGGSTTFGGENPEEETYPRLLEAALRRRSPGADIEVVNCGVAGYTSVETVIDFALRGLDLEPDVVILYHGVNDVPAALTPGFRSDYSHWTPPHRRVPGGEPTLPERSLLWLTLRWKIERRATAEAEAPLLEEPPPEAIGAIERNTRSVVRLAKARGARVVLPSFAERIHLYPDLASEKPLYAGKAHPSADAFRKTLAAFNEVLRRVAREEGALHPDLHALLPDSKDAFLDWMHLTDAGNAAMADLLAAAIAE